MGHNETAASPDLTRRSAHTCHIPVMGTGFTIDSPLKVARYGLESTISLVDDELIEQMRAFHSRRNGLEYAPIARDSEDHRARRITAFLNLIGQLVAEQVRELRELPFTPDSDLTRYFELLPDCAVRRDYERMCATADEAERERLAQELRRHVLPGQINVNIMTKMDSLSSRLSVAPPVAGSDGLAAVRGFAHSKLDSAVELSAGLNRRLFTYLGEFADFLPAGNDPPRKQVILKVSDYRSALVQGKLLAKCGVLVGEFRVESGINCGGHAFIDKGQLVGPVLQEFQDNQGLLEDELLTLQHTELRKRGLSADWRPDHIRITVQGGIGTNEEAQMLARQYGVDGTGWGTPFLLVPEVTNVDPGDLARLAAADEANVYLSEASPLGVPFWNLRNSASERARENRITAGSPGSACRKGYAAVNTEFPGPPLCVASRAYQRLKLAEIEQTELTKAERDAAIEHVTVKSCICHDLAGNATRKYHIDEQATPAVCCGPGIADFAGPLTLEALLDHIYGRKSLFADLRRPHMFIREIRLYIDYIKQRLTAGPEHSPADSLRKMIDNLAVGVDYYRKLGRSFLCDRRRRFLADLEKLALVIEELKRVAVQATTCS